MEKNKQGKGKDLSLYRLIVAVIYSGKRDNRMVDFENVGFSNSFMFGKIMEKPERAKPFLEQILGFKIDHIEYLEREKGIDEKFDGRGIRMDIYAEDGKTVYDCEMQTTDKGNLPKRSRYYQSLIDIRLLKRKDDFKVLQRSFVIFVCTFDPFLRGEYIYSFENRCNEVPDLILNDEAYRIFVNTKGTKGDVSEEFRELMRFVDTSEDRCYGNDLANELLSDLKAARTNQEWRDTFMTWERYGKECREEGREEGREESIHEMVENMIRENIPTDVIARIAKVAPSEVEKIMASMSVTA